LTVIIKSLIIYFDIEVKTGNRMSLSVQFAHPGQWQEVASLHRERTFYHSPLRDILQAEIRAFQVRKLTRLFEIMKTNQELVMLIALKRRRISGYMILYFGHEDDISGEPQCLIVDFYSLDDDHHTLSLLLSRAEETLREVGFRYLVIVWPITELPVTTRICR